MKLSFWTVCSTGGDLKFNGVFYTGNLVGMRASVIQLASRWSLGHFVQIQDAYYFPIISTMYGAVRT